MRYLQLFRYYLYAGIKAKTAYPWDFFAGLFSAIAYQAINLCILFVIFSLVEDIKGWSVHGILMIYGLSQICFGISESLTENLWWVGNYARSGELAKYLSTPLNTLFSVLFERIHLDRLLNSVFGFICFFYGLNQIDSTISYLFLGNFMIFGSLINISMLIIGGASLISLKDNSTILPLLNNVAEFSKYPTSIFPKILANVFLSVLPIGLIAYLPTRSILEGDWALLAYIDTVSIFFFVLAALIWKLSIRSYEPTGS